MYHKSYKLHHCPSTKNKKKITETCKNQETKSVTVLQQTCKRTSPNKKQIRISLGSLRGTECTANILTALSHGNPNIHIRYSRKNLFHFPTHIAAIHHLWFHTAVHSHGSRRHLAGVSQTTQILILLVNGGLKSQHVKTLGFFQYYIMERNKLDTIKYELRKQLQNIERL